MRTADTNNADFCLLSLWKDNVNWHWKSSLSYTFVMRESNQKTIKNRHQTQMACIKNVMGDTATPVFTGLKESWLLGEGAFKSWGQMPLTRLNEPQQQSHIIRAQNNWAKTFLAHRKKTLFLRINSALSEDLHYYISAYCTRIIIYSPHFHTRSEWMRE